MDMGSRCSFGAHVHVHAERGSRCSCGAPERHDVLPSRGIPFDGSKVIRRRSLGKCLRQRLGVFPSAALTGGRCPKRVMSGKAPDEHHFRFSRNIGHCAGEGEEPGRAGGEANRGD
jgi:hypothetical protein